MSGGFMSKLEPIVFHLLKHYTYYDTESFEKLYNEGNLSMMFFAIRKVDVINAYKDVFQFLPDEIKYEAFFDVYTRAEYRFTAFTIKILEAVRKLRPDSVIQELGKFADDKGFITIYRGECTKSTPVQKALSWTLDKEKAVWFAKRFLCLASDIEKIGYVYTAKVNLKNIIGYYDGRKESEVVVRYKHLEIISTEEVRSDKK